jgi:hypothetical protein
MGSSPEPSKCNAMLLNLFKYFVIETENGLVHTVSPRVCTLWSTVLNSLFPPTLPQPASGNHHSILHFYEFNFFRFHNSWDHLVFILFILKKWGNFFICNNADEAEGHTAKWIKPGPQRQVLHFSFLFSTMSSN